MKKLIFTIVIILIASTAHAANWYVDNAVSVSGDGTSWATAWKNLTNITRVTAGDTVYISGGSTGNTQTYAVPTGAWQPTGGSLGNPITYQIGQDAGHNGTVIFTIPSGTNPWLYLDTSQSNLVISGDAGDGAQHFKITNEACAGYGCVDGNLGRANHVRISYVNFQTQGSIMYFWNNGGSGYATGLEIDHNVMDADPSADHLIFIAPACTGYGQNWIHDNVMTGLTLSNGLGVDFIQDGFGCLDIYNNWFHSSVGAYTSGQHQDGYQSISNVQYLKIYNNRFTNISNYAIYIEGAASGSNGANLMFYNNQIEYTDSAFGSGGHQGIAIGPHVGGLSWTNVLVANNTFVDYVGSWCIAVRDPGPYSPPVTWTNVRVINNICWNGSGNIIDTGVTNLDNITSKTGTHFVRYTEFSLTNDMHLLGADTTFGGQGANLSSDFTTDKDGYARQATGAWDIGAYEYSGLRPDPPQNLQVQ